MHSEICRLHVLVIRLELGFVSLEYMLDEAKLLASC
jgi:hypothetical protein